MASGYPAAVTLAYNAIMRSEVFRLNGPTIDLPRALCLLGRALSKHELPEDIWCGLGEFTEACLGDLVIGAYWALSEWHGGQSSDTYAALSSLSCVYDPGMSSGPEPETGEHDAYVGICAWLEAQ